MTKITRPSKNIVAFGSNAEGTERTTFGTTTQANDLDSNLNDSFARGWGIVAGSDLPTKQDFNAMGYTLGQLNAYLYQMGIAEYDVTQEYHQSSFTNYNGVIYKSLTNNNVGNTPNTSTSNWESVIDGKYLPITGGTLSGDLTIQQTDARFLLRSGNVGTIFKNESSGVFSISYFDGTSASVKAYYAPSSNTLNFVNLSNVTINNTPVLKKNDYGLGAETTVNVLLNINQALPSGYYTINSSTSGSVPFPQCIMMVSRRTTTEQMAIAISQTTPAVKSGYYLNGTWNWQELITTANVGSYTSSGLGYDQTWQDVKDSRDFNTIYTNTTKKPIYVSVVVRVDGSNGKTCSLLVGDVITSALTTTNYGQIGNCRSVTLSAIVPNGTTYTLSSPNFKPNIENWSELR